MLAVRGRTGATIEVLTPDFDGRTEAIDVVLEARPEVFNHNMETVAGFQQHVRRKSQYRSEPGGSRARQEAGASHGIRTKSGLMLGLGETIEELFRNARRPAQSAAISSRLGSIFNHPRATCRSSATSPPTNSTS